MDGSIVHPLRVIRFSWRSLRSLRLHSGELLDEREDH
jgi:hypothetical protein